MVEGPEATYQGTYLKKHFAGRRLAGIKIKDGRYKHHGPPANYRAFVSSLPHRLLDVGNKGKALFLLFEGGWVIIAKLGMSGWFYRPQDKPWFEPRPNIVFDFAGGGSLFYSDFRNFGTLTFTQDMMTVLTEYNSIAEDIFSEKATWRHLQPCITALQTHYPRMTIDTLLMDQTMLVSGIGNIIKSEILYDARISPRRSLASLKPNEWQAIIRAARRFAKQTLAILEAGDYAAYVSIRQVYNKTHDKLNNKVVQYVSADGRKTYWVPAIQV